MPFIFITSMVVVICIGIVMVLYTTIAKTSEHNENQRHISQRAATQAERQKRKELEEKEKLLNSLGMLHVEHPNRFPTETTTYVKRRTQLDITEQWEKLLSINSAHQNNSDQEEPETPPEDPGSDFLVIGTDGNIQTYKYF